MAVFENLTSQRITGIGSALVDILLQESDAFLEKTGAQKGGMTLVDAEKIASLVALSDKQPAIVPGGSACNTIIGVGKLGGPARFVGKRGTDNYGTFFEKDLKANNVEPHLFTTESPTGHVLSIITPDAQRSMFTYLGASSETRTDEISRECFADTALVHVEGYLLFNKDLILKALQTAKDAGALISLDLASFTVVEAARDILDDLAKNYVDILIANEDEARAFTGTDDEEKSLEILAEKSTVAVLKQGKRGSMISAKGEVCKVDIMGDGSALDTTGAGDLWAAGFLYGLINGFDIELCGKLGSACGYEVCQVIGAAIPEEGWTRIQSLVK